MDLNLNLVGNIHTGPVSSAQAPLACSKCGGLPFGFSCISAVLKLSENVTLCTAVQGMNPRELENFLHWKLAGHCELLLRLLI